MYSARRKGILVLLGTALAAIFIALAILFAPAFTRPAEAASDEQTADSVASIYKSGDHYYDSLQEAVDAAEGYAAGNVSPTIKLLKDVNLTESVTLDASAIKSGKYIKIDGQDHTLSASSVQQPFQIVGGADVAADVEVRISDLTMESTVAQANLLSVAGGNFSLVLDTVTLDTTGAGSNDRALSIGWNSTEPGTVGIEMTDCTLQASASGYAIMTYNPVELSIENSALTGYAALYMYNDNYGNGTGSAGSAVTIDGSTITANNPYATGSGSDFGAIVFKDKDIRVDIRNSDITVNATGTSHHGIVLFDTNTGSSIYTESTDVTLNGSSAHFIITTRGGSGTLQFGAGTRSNRAFDFENDDVLGSGFTSVADGDGYVVSATDPAATCGGIGCVSLQNAIDTAKEGQAATIVLHKDVAENVTIPANKEIVLDLNGHNVTAASGTAITNNGTLTVKDSTAAGDGEGYTAGTVSAASKAIYSTGPLTVEGGIFLGNYAVDTKCGPVVIHAGVFEGKSYPAVQFNKADGALQIEGGSFTSESTNYGAVYVYAADSVYIEDAAITGGTYGVYLKEANEATICGETAISATNTASKNLAALYALNVDMTIRDNVVADQLIRLGNGATVNIESGTYNAPLTNVATNGNATTGKFSITGGTFVSEDIVEWFDPSWLVDGSDIYALRSTGVAGQYIVNAYNNDDTDMIYVGGYVAAVDGVNYTTLADALAAAEGKTLKLLTNADEPLTIGATMTLDLGTFSVRASGTALTVNSGVTLTIEGSGRVYGEIANNGTLVLRGGIYAADQIGIDWVAEDRAIAYDSVDELYTVSDDIGVTLTRGDRAYNFTNLVTPFNAGIAESGDTFVLQKDIAGGITLGENRNGKEYTIDMNGHDINGAFILYAGTLNIVNNSAAKAVSTISNAQRIFQLLPAEGCVVKLTLGENIDLMAGTEGVFIQTPITNDDIGNPDELQPVAILHSSANILSKSSFAIVGNGTGHGTEIVIDGGSVKTSGNAPAIYHPQYGVLTVKGGAVIEGVTGIEIRNGILNVEDATIRSTADSFVAGATPSGGGSTVTGAAIAVTKYNNTLVPLQVNIGEATLQASANGVALYEGYPDADSGKLPAGNAVEMSVDGAVFEAAVVSKNETNFIKSGTFGAEIPVEYIAEDSLLIPAGDGTYTVEDYESAVGTVTGLIVGNAVYADIAAAEEAGVHVVATIAANESLSYGYTALIDALREANADNTVVLLEDIELSSGITIGKSFNLDMNEHSITISGGGTLFIKGTDVTDGVSVEISNGSIAGDNYGILVYDNVALTLTDVNVTGGLEGIFVPSSVNDIAATQPTTITIEGGIFKGTGENGAGAVICGVGDGVEAPTKLVATGAVFEGTTYGISGNGTAHNTYIELSDCTVNGEVGIYNPQDGELIVNGGSVYGESTGIEIRSGSLTVNGGAEITGAGDPFASDPNGNGTTTTGAAIAVSQHTTNLPIKVTVNDAVLNGVRALFEADLQDEIATDQITITVLGGTFNGEVVSENVTGFVKGGAFTEALDAAYVAADAYFYPTDTGYEASTTAPAAGATTAVAVVNGYYYCKTLAEAVAAAEEGDTVTLHADITTAAMITIDKAVTLDLNGHGVIGGSTNSNFVMEITAGGVTVTNSVSAEEESIVQAGSAEIGALAIRSGLTEEVTIENITILIDDDRTSKSGNIVGIQLQSPTLIDNVTIDISASYHLVLGILAADGEATISNSTFTVRGKEGSDAEVHAIHAQAGADIQLIDSAITATGNGTGVVFIGEYANGEEAISAGSSAFPTLTITDSTIVSDSFALAGNGASHGTVIEINNSTLTSELAAAIYHPQYGEMTIVNSNITGTSGIEVRAGIVTVTSGTITATGDPFASDPNGNGSTTDGAAIALVQHTTQLPTEVTVTGGTLNGIRAFYQANLQGNDAAALEKIAINLQGGTYNGEVYSENKTGYITGGQYRDLPAEDAFLEGYAGELFNGYYVVVESGEAGDTADLLAMRLEAQADVRLYAVALGLNWADVSGDADIAAAYAAINTATSESIIALAKAQAMDAVDAYYNTIVDARAEAIEAIEQAAGSDVTVPTATYAAINGAMSAKEIAYYRENALAEIQAIRSLRSEITAQAGELEGIAAAVEKLEGAFAGQGGEFDSLLGDIRAAISAAQEAIESGTSEALQDMQAALEAKIDAGTQAVKDAVAGVMEELTQLAESVAAGDKALQEAIAAGEKALAEQIEAVQGDIDALEGAVDGQGSDLQASIDALESAVGEQASAVQADIDALRAAIAAAQADIDDILASIAAGGPSFEELAEQIAAIKSTADGLQTSVGDVQTAVKAAQDAVAAAQGALSGQIEEADDAAAFTTLYVLVGIALALSAAAVALLVVLLLKRSKAE